MRRDFFTRFHGNTGEIRYTSLLSRSLAKSFLRSTVHPLDGTRRQPLSLAESISVAPSLENSGESRKRATLNGANRRCRAAKGCRLKGKQFSWKQLTADWRERTRGSERAHGRDIWRSMHASLPARERSYICPTMKIDFERARVRATGGPRGRELLKHSFPDQEFVFLVTMPRCFDRPPPSNHRRQRVTPSLILSLALSLSFCLSLYFVCNVL